MKQLWLSILEWCSSSIVVSNNTNSYLFMNKFVISLYEICFMLIITGVLLYMTLMKQSFRPIIHKRLLFWFGIVILGMFVGSSVCNQLISSLTCRPIEMIYNIRYTLMLATQMIGFIASLYFAYGFGQIYGPLLDQRTNSKIPK
jgi:uncharacterized membrane protein AbrB (regulator of aidB expression)